MKKRALALLLAMLLGLLCGCGSLFSGSYYHETDYALPAPPEQIPDKDEKVTVADAAALKTELLAMVYAGTTEGRISFDPAYVGDSRADLEAICGTMHREDALWAYCVQNTRYEISHIVTHDEADIHIEYAPSAVPTDSILKLNYSVGLDRTIRAAMESDSRRLVILIGNSSYSADAMIALVGNVYRSNPACAVVMPAVDVYMYSGSGRQRLYEIELDYGLDDEELQRRRAELAAVDSSAFLGEDRSDGMRALDLARYLVGHCSLTGLSSRNSAWDALIGGKANSEGLALAYVQLCRQQNIPCQIVYGQYQWRDHCWNIIGIEGQHYHVDLAACLRDGIREGFLLNDEAMWAEYRWDTSSYDICAGSLDYWLLTGEEREPTVMMPFETEAPAESEEPEPSEEPTEPPAESEEPAETPLPEETAEPEPTEGDS